VTRAERYETHFDVHDGSRVHVRALRPGDEEALHDAFSRMSERSVYFRFFSPLKRLPEDLAHRLAQVDGEVRLQPEGEVTQRSVLDALEAHYPMLRGTIRDQVTKKRRPFLRFFACAKDLTHERPDAPLPEAVVNGDEPFIILGAMAGG